MSVEDIPPSLSPEEAELLAAKITPSWEAPPMDEETATDIVVPSAYNTPLVPPMHAETEPKLVAAEIRREAGADIPKPDGNSDFPTQRGKDASKLEEEIRAKLAASPAAPNGANGANGANEEGAVDPTVRMPSITDGLSDGDIVAAEPVAIPAPPRGPTPSGPPPRKPPAPTANMIPYVPEGDRFATTARVRGVEDDDIPESSVRGSNKGLVIAVVALVAVVAFGGVFFALRSSGASVDPVPSGHAGMVQQASSKGDVPAPEALPEGPAPSAAASADTKKPAASPSSAQANAAPPPVATPKSSPVTSPPSTPHAAAGGSPKGGNGSSGGGTPVKPPPAGGKPGGIVRDNPF